MFIFFLKIGKIIMRRVINMEMTPLVRYKNISFENVKNFLKMYPYIIDTTTWNEAYNNFDFSKINTNKES